MENPTEDDLSTIWTTFADELENVDNPVEEAKLGEQFSEVLAQATGDADNPRVDSMLSEAASVSNTNKTMYKEMVEEAARDLPSDSSNTATYLDAYIEENLDELHITLSTDSCVETTYTWHFEDCVIETKGEHRSPGTFKTMIFDEVHEMLTGPSDSIDDWQDWIDAKATDYDSKTRVRGPRTQAIEDLKDMLSTTSVVVDDLKTAIRSSQMYMTDSDADTVYVSNDIVSRSLHDHEVSMRALQAEMSDKGYLTRNSKRVPLPNGGQATMWCLDADWIDFDIIDADEQGDEDE